MYSPQSPRSITLVCLQYSGIKLHTSRQRSRVTHKQQPLPAYSSLIAAFPVTARFHLIRCASLVMDYLPAVSQYNDIQCCSTSRTLRSKDENSLHFLFGSPELLLLGFGVSSIDFELSLHCFSCITVRLSRSYSVCVCLSPSLKFSLFEIPEIVRLYSK